MSASDQQAIREVIRTWMEATAAGDVDRVLSSSSRAITPTSGAACVSPQRPEGGQPMRRSAPVLSVFRRAGRQLGARARRQHAERGETYSVVGRNFTSGEARNFCLGLSPIRSGV